MKTKLPWILTAILAIALIAVVTHRSAARPSADAHAEHKTAERKILYWVDPMHPQYKSDKPGKAPDCGMDLVPVYEDGGAPASSTVQGYANVSLPPARQQLIGVQTAIAERRTIGTSVRAVGRVAADETRLYKITTKFEGYIEKLYVNFTGQPVRRGEALFSIYSPELLATQQEYLLAMRAAKQSPLLLEASRQRLKLWDISDREIRSLERGGAARKTLTISSPASGVVTVKNVVEGARVNPGDSLFEIADLERVWVVADVYESELGALRVGAPADITLSFAPGRVFKGRVSFVAPTVDPMTKTVKVRVDVDNRDGALKPEMFADVTLSEPQREVTAVPQSAVINTGTRAIVFVVDEKGTFQPREVATGASDGNFVEVRSGVNPGEKVATQANFLIDSESRLKAALQQMSGGTHSAHQP